MPGPFKYPPTPQHTLPHALMQTRTMVRSHLHPHTHTGPRRRRRRRQTYARVPAGAKRGDSSVIRLLCRYKALITVWPAPPSPAAAPAAAAPAAAGGAAGGADAESASSPPPPPVSVSVGMEMRDWADTKSMGKERATLLSQLEGGF
jgi:hypothetical protein